MNRIYSISTDAVGFFGDFKRWQKYYPEVECGIELLGWKHNINRWIESGAKINGIHGRLGDNNNIKLKFLNAALVDDQEIASAAERTKAKYILMHEPALNIDNIEFIESLNEKIVVLVENSDVMKSWQNTIKLVKEINQRIGKNRLGVMLDLVHLGYQIQKEKGGKLSRNRMADDWVLIIKTAEEILKESKIAGIHLPIGTTDDSLPENLINDKGIWPIKRLLDDNPTVRFVTIENQNDNQYGIGGITGQIVDRNKKNLEMLTRVGIGHFGK